MVRVNLTRQSRVLKFVLRNGREVIRKASVATIVTVRNIEHNKTPTKVYDLTKKTPESREA